MTRAQQTISIALLVSSVSALARPQRRLVKTTQNLADHTILRHPRSSTSPSTSV